MVLLKQTARDRTQEPLENQWKGGEFKRSGRTRSRRKRRRKYEKKEKAKYRRSSWWKWKQFKERIASFLAVKFGRDGKEEKGRKSDKRTRTGQVLGESGRWLFLFVLLGQNWLCVNAAADGLQIRTEMMARRQQQEVQAKESRWAEEIPQRWKN